MNDPQAVLAELENFFNFQIEHTKRHRLDKFLMTVDKANILLGKIREARSASTVGDQSRQESYNAWFTQEIEKLKQQVASLQEKLQTSN
jgi:polyhydroxyalkanoate synthesis regulator phasin